MEIHEQNIVSFLVICFIIIFYGEKKQKIKIQYTYQKKNKEHTYHKTKHTTPNLKTNTEHYIQKTNTQFPKSGDGQKMHAKI